MEPTQAQGNPPACVGCAHHHSFTRGSEGARYHECWRIVVFDPVRGDIRKNYPCDDLRQPGQACGPSGALFEPKQPSRFERLWDRWARFTSKLAL